jgi:hypothetical protein
LHHHKTVCTPFILISLINAVSVLSIRFCQQIYRVFSYMPDVSDFGNGRYLVIFGFGERQY